MTGNEGISIRGAALSLFNGLRSMAESIDIDEVRKIVPELKNRGEFGLLDGLVNKVKQSGIQDFVVDDVHVQSLIERGLPEQALVLLGQSAGKDVNGQLANQNGLKARAWKEVLYDIADKGSDVARTAIVSSLEEYRHVYDSNPDNRVRPALNLIALSTLARQFDVPVPADIDRLKLATSVLDDLNRTPQADRNAMFHASRAEAFVALGNLDGAQAEISKFVQDPSTTAFSLAGVTRQLSELWNLDAATEQGDGIVQAMYAALLDKDFSRTRLSPAAVGQLAAKSAPPTRQLEAILGPDGPQTYQWFRNGLDVASSVGVVRISGSSQRIGTGFVVRGGDIVQELGDEPCLLTNAHVISDEEPEALPSADGEVVFEAVDKNRIHKFASVARTWPKNGLDASLLRITDPNPTIKPLNFAKKLPLADGKQRVYVIGYPSGGELAFSLENNRLLEHEGPPNGVPSDNPVRRVQYAAPTEVGSSGSPVFNGFNWQVIALHHAGGMDMPRLNGQAGSWPANEGIWVQSIVAAGAKA